MDDVANIPWIILFNFFFFNIFSAFLNLYLEIYSLKLSSLIFVSRSSLGLPQSLTHPFSRGCQGLGQSVLDPLLFSPFHLFMLISSVSGQCG